MTDHTPLTDEELSAHLDGRADPDVSARLAADPESQARAEALSRARDALGTPVAPLASHQIDQLVAAALEEPAASDQVMAPLRAGNRTGAPRWLAAAAAVIVLAGIGFILSGVIGRSGSTDAGDTATAARSTTSLTTGADKAAPEATPGHSGGSVAADSAASATFDEAAARRFAASASDLGVFADADALRTALKTSWPTAPPVTRSKVAADQRTAQQIARCATQVQTVLRLTTSPTQVGYARLAGDPVLVFEFANSSYENGTPTSIVSAADPVACDPKVTFER